MALLSHYLNCQEKKLNVNHFQPPQVLQYQEPKETEVIQITTTLSLPSEHPGYTLIIPAGPMKGMAIMFHSGWDTSHRGFEMRFYKEGSRRQLGVMYVTTGNPFEFLFDTIRFFQIDAYIGQAIDQYPEVKEKLLFAGISLAGTRAMKFSLWCQQGKSPHGIKPRTLAICVPLDFHRFWQDSKKAIIYQTNPTSENEAEWVNYQLEEHLGGTPVQALEAYTRYSPYAKLWNINHNAQLLKGVATRAYTEPDVQWWITNRQKDYYGMNAMDAALLINDLKIVGHREAELITTSGEGYHPDGRRHPHSWSIVDHVELVEWFLGLDEVKMPDKDH